MTTTGPTAEPGPAPQTPGGDALLRVTDLRKHFPITPDILCQRKIGAVKAVDGVSFQVAAGRRSGWWVSRAVASPLPVGWWPSC